MLVTVFSFVSADVQKGPESWNSCSNPETPEKASHSVTREATTGFISTTRRQDGDSLQDVTCESHLESDHHSGGSAERLGSAEPELREVPPREGELRLTFKPYCAFFGPLVYFHYALSGFPSINQ
uniref:Uncharacterized protein n=1 Tax=Schistocephalus solidus TaxID=70667 RepID=A0A0V0J8L8_SCHSO